jgi:hypothetical protein
MVVTCSVTGRGGSAHCEAAERLCVALTRARSHLLLVGCATALWGVGEGGRWRAVLEAAAEAESGVRSIAMRPLLAPGPKNAPLAGAWGAAPPPAAAAHT